jgi:hypothetical protein
MDVPVDLAGRLKLALKVINLSPGALAGTVGVDKSVVSRWLSGKVVPNGHNMSRISAEITRRRPEFSALMFEAPGDVFLASLGLHPAEAPPHTGEGLILPHGALNTARRETARRGSEYFGHYAMYYWSFSNPGKIARMALMLRPSERLIEARYGANDFEFRGWALLMLNRLYIQFVEKRYEAMAFLVTNSGQQPRTLRMTGMLMGPSDQLMSPTASPVLILREGDVTGDDARDEVEFRRRQAFEPIAAGEAAPPEVRAGLLAQVRAVAVDDGSIALLQALDLAE